MCSSDLASIEYYGGQGVDHFENRTNLPCKAYGYEGDDILIGGGGIDRLEGGPGNDTILGQGGEDILIGEQGVDRIHGGAGHDDLYGGEGFDDLVGGTGIDFFARDGIDNVWTDDPETGGFVPFDGSMSILTVDDARSRTELVPHPGLPETTRLLDLSHYWGQNYGATYDAIKIGRAHV